MNRTYLLIILTSLIPIMLVITYRTQVDTFFGTTNASNYLLVGLIVVDFLGNFLVYFLGKKDEEAKRPNLQILGVRTQKGDYETTLRVAVMNIGISTAKECYGRMTLHCSKDDVRNIPGTPTMITPDNFMIVDGSELCWSKHGNTSIVSIPYEASQDLEIVRKVQIQQSVFLIIPSDQGWGKWKSENVGGTHKIPIPDKLAKIGLVAKSYEGSLFIGGDGIQPIRRNFRIIYDEKTKEIHLELRPFLS